MINDLVDKVYWINSNNRPDRFINMKERLKGITAERFVAIHGGDLPSSELSHHLPEPRLLWDGKTGTNLRILNNSEIGCFQSHVAIYKKIKEQGFKTTLILEDDALFCEDFNEKVKQIEPLKDWDIIYFGQWNYDQGVKDGSFEAIKEHATGDIYKADRCWLTHAYIVNLRCIDFLLENTRHMYASLDNVLADIQHQLKVYAFHPNIINQDGTKSSLR